MRRGASVRRRLGGIALALALAGAGVPPGANPHPVRLIRPAIVPLSAMARLGRRIFLDPSLSASGRLSCASCHSPAHHYGPPGALPAMFGGPDLRRQGVRAVPSLMYLERQPNFAIGPDNAEAEGVDLRRAAARGLGATRARKIAGGGAGTANLVPQGGLFWDGRADTLQAQAMGPLLSPFEMDGGSRARLARILARAPYAARFSTLFGPAIFAAPRRLLAEALFALARYQIEAPQFHPYASKFDAWLEGKARLTPAELRGWQAFNDPRRGNCAACHPDRPTPDHRPPLFTDHQFEALGVPRNRALGANRDPAWFDLGLCGPYRADLARERRYCGLFATPSLRNVATRHAFFHNGVYRSLRQVLDFYDFRDTAPWRVYPRAHARGGDGRIAVFDDLPARYRGTIDRADAPFGRARGAPPPLSAAEERDIIAFLGTLTDGD